MKEQSPIFYTNTHKELAQKVKDFLNKQNNFLSQRTQNSPRAVGDAIESIVSDNFKDIIGDIAGQYFANFARRSLADLAFIDNQGFYYAVDVKTHRLDTVFNMPNLTSVQRLSKFYENDKNYFCILKIDYRVAVSKVIIENVTFVPIEFLDWDCLTVGALGWGQIQIANANTVTIISSNSRKKWMLNLCNRLLEFYPAEMNKIKKRISYFEKAKEFWEKKENK
ncbi:MAG: hypothetical protein WC449_04580 [Candidatus Paceibacterota bacterium]